MSVKQFRGYFLEVDDIPQGNERIIKRLFKKLCQNKTTVFYKSGCQRFVGFELELDT